MRFFLADILTNFGKLNEFFKLIQYVILNYLRFIFLIQETKKGEYIINQNGRFSHSHSYIAKISQLNNLIIGRYQGIKIRKENNKWLDGKIFTVMKNQQIFMPLYL